MKEHGQDARATGGTAFQAVKEHGQDAHATGGTAFQAVKQHGQDAHATGGTAFQAVKQHGQDARATGGTAFQAMKQHGQDAHATLDLTGGPGWRLGECGPLADDRKYDMICELDAVVAHLYGLTEAHLRHIFETFHEGWGPGTTRRRNRSAATGTGSKPAARRADRPDAAGIPTAGSLPS